MHSAYVAPIGLVGLAKSAWLVWSPFRYFQISLSLLSSALLLISSCFLPAARQPPLGAFGHAVVRHVSLASAQMNVHGLVPGAQLPDRQVSLPLQNCPSEQSVPSGSTRSVGQ